MGRRRRKNVRKRKEKEKEKENYRYDDVCTRTCAVMMEGEESRISSRSTATRRMPSSRSTASSRYCMHSTVLERLGVLGTEYSALQALISTAQAFDLWLLRHPDRFLHLQPFTGIGAAWQTRPRVLLDASEGEEAEASKSEQGKPQHVHSMIQEDAQCCTVQ